MSYSSTHFTSLAHTKLRNVTVYKLHNTYNQLKASHRGFQQLEGGGGTAFIVFQFQQPSDTLLARFDDLPLISTE